MPKKEETINLDSGLNVSSIQITINLGQPVGGPKTQPPDIDVTPAGTLVRQVLPDPSDNTKLKVRVTFVPDDSEQVATVDIKDPDIGNKSKWAELLSDPGVDIDSGITLLRFNAAGGVATWLPDDINGNLIVHVLQEGPHETGGVSVGDFIGCWSDKGGNAGAAVGCLDRL
jgi:hypothetical protein